MPTALRRGIEPPLSRFGGFLLPFSHASSRGISCKREASRRWLSTHKEEHKAHSRRWKRENAARWLLSRARSNAKQRDRELTFTEEEVEARTPLGSALGPEFDSSKAHFRPTPSNGAGFRAMGRQKPRYTGC